MPWNMYTILFGPLGTEKVHVILITALAQVSDEVEEQISRYMAVLMTCFYLCAAVASPAFKVKTRIFFQ